MAVRFRATALRTPLDAVSLPRRSYRSRRGFICNLRRPANAQTLPPASVQETP